MSILQKGEHNKGFKSFAVKLGIFCATVAALDVATGTVLKKIYHRQKSGPEYRTKFGMETSKAETMIFGSSRAEWIFNPKVIETALNTSCYNLGRNGQPIFYHYGVLKSVLQRHRPKTVIFSTDLLAFTKFEESYDRISTLLPYYQSHPEIREIVHLKGRFEPLKMYSFTYPYNSQLLAIISGQKTNGDEEYYQGYKPLTNIISGEPDTKDFRKDTVIDRVKLQYFQNFVTDCKNAGVKLVLVCPPYYAHILGNDPSNEAIKKIATAEGIPYLDHSVDSFYFNRPNWFADYKHLNHLGVDSFTQQIMQEIKALK
jgi:hypothetical protein